MNKRKIAALLGVFTLLACTAAATRDKTIQPPKDSRAQRAAQEYAETTALRAEDEGRYKVLKKKLENVTKKLAKEKNVPEDRLSRKEKLEQNVRQREMILKEWEKHQDELLQNGRGAANANPAKKTPASAELEELEKRTEKLYRKLQRKVYRLYSSTNKPGDEMDEVVALNEKVNRCREKLKEAADTPLLTSGTWRSRTRWISPTVWSWRLWPRAASLIWRENLREHSAVKKRRRKRPRFFWKWMRENIPTSTISIFGQPAGFGQSWEPSCRSAYVMEPPPCDCPTT